jgi:hypothetical protein
MSNTFLLKISRFAHDPKTPRRVYCYILRKLGLSYGEFLTWESRRFAPPSPHFIKQTVLRRYSLPNCTWIETGTHLGYTTQKLAKIANFVYSIEPEPTLYKNAKKKLAKYINVEIINSLSEISLPLILDRVSGNVCFWLDGHYSAGNTFKGPQDTPILNELDAISNCLKRLDKVVILIDDVRCFDPNDPEYSTYPPIKCLVDWAIQNHLSWMIEHDIFIAKNF